MRTKQTIRSSRSAEKTDKPLGFLSYSHFDDEHNQGWITEFCKVLSGEVQAQTGEPFPIFQDRDDIKWGQNWRARIKAALNTATFLFPIITPSFLKSRESRREIREFLKHERSQGRDDLVFSIYYIRCKQLEDERGTKKTDSVVRAIKQHQRFDLTDLRFESLKDLTVRKLIADMAMHIRDAIDRVQEDSKLS